MKIADMLNPTVIGHLSSPPLSPRQQKEYYYCQPNMKTKRNNSTSSSSSNSGKPRSRFSDVEDAIICDGVARGLTWGQISGQLPHRKRATCFNRYRTLQGIRKSRNNSTSAAATTVTTSAASATTTIANTAMNAAHTKRTTTPNDPTKTLPLPNPKLIMDENNMMMRSPPITPPNSSAWLPSSPPTKSNAKQPENTQRRNSLHHHSSYHLHRHQLPALVAPLPTRLPLPYSYARP